MNLLFPKHLLLDVACSVVIPADVGTEEGQDFTVLMRMHRIIIIGVAINFLKKKKDQYQTWKYLVVLFICL